MRSNWAIIALLSLLISGVAQAHKMRSVLLTITEQPAAAGQATQLVTLDLKSSLNKNGQPAAVTTRFTPACVTQGSSVAERLDDAVLRRYRVNCTGGLAGRQLHVDGLDPTTPDAFVQIHFANGITARHGLSRSLASIQLDDTQTTQTNSGPTALWPYFGIGVEHILLGIDHLLFVFGLLLLLRITHAHWRSLISTITAFTVAHSITMALTVLGGVTLPSTPVEIVIALSILLLAMEIYRHPQRLTQGLSPTLTISQPWLMAFGFGLLHGFGFAGALADIGVPADAAGWALLLFNIGVEAGQLLFVATMLTLALLLSKLTNHRRTLPLAHGLALHAMGGLAVFWIIERALPLFTT